MLSLVPFVGTLLLPVGPSRPILPAQDELPLLVPGRRVEVLLTTDADSRARFRTSSGDEPGTLYVWIETDGAPVQGRLTRARGWSFDAAPDRPNSSANWAPLDGDSYELTVCRLGSVATKVRIHQDVAVETEATRALVTAGGEMLVGARASSSGDEIVLLLRAWLERLRETPDAPASKEVNDQLWAIGEELGSEERAWTGDPPAELFPLLEEVWQQVLVFAMHFLPPAHPDPLLAREYLAEALRGQGRLEEARGILEELALVDEAFPGGSSAGDRAWARLAWLQRDLGDPEAELRCLLRADAGMTKALVVDEPFHRRIVDRLVELLEAQGRGAEASALASRKADPARKRLAAATAALTAAGEALGKGDHESGTSLREEALAELVALAEEHPPERVEDVDHLARRLRELGSDFAERRRRDLAERAFTAEVSLLRRVLPPEAERLQYDLLDLATIRANAGQGARALVEIKDVLAVFERTLSPEDPRLLEAMNRAGILSRMHGDPAYGAALLERVLAARERLLPEDDPYLRRTAHELMLAYDRSNDPARGLALAEKELALLEPRVANDDRELLRLRKDAANLAYNAGRLERSVELYQDLVAALERSEGASEEQVLDERRELAATLLDLGDLDRALEMQLAVVERLSEIKEPGEELLVRASRDLAMSLESAGRLIESNALLRRITSEAEAVHAPESLLCDLTAELARCAGELGDLTGSKTLFEEAFARAGSPPIPGFDFGRARANYGVLLYRLGEKEEALAIFREAEEVFTSKLRVNHHFILTARNCIARVLSDLGHYEEAVEIGSDVAARFDGLGPRGAAGAAYARSGLVTPLTALGRLDRAIEVGQQALAWIRASRAPDDRFSMAVHERLAVAQARAGDEEGLSSSVRGLLDGLRAMVRTSESLSVRGRQEIARTSARHVSSLLSLDQLLPEGHPIHREVFEAVEELRRLSASSSIWVGGNLESVQAKRSRLRELRSRLSASTVQAQWGQGERESGVRTFATLSRERDRLEAELAREAVALGIETVPIRMDEVAAALPPHTALVAFHGYGRSSLLGDVEEITRVRRSLMAAVLTGDGRLRRVQLGPREAIEQAIERWRGSVAAETAARESRDAVEVSGTRLRELVLDPILAGVGADVRRVVVCLDDVLHLVPLEALPFEVEGRAGYVGERFRIVRSPSLGRGVGQESSTGGVGAGPRLLALGGIDYDAEGAGPRPDGPELGGRERGLGPSRSLTYLRHSLEEVQVIGAAFEESQGREPQLLTGAEATKAAFLRLAPSATYLHVATHGYSTQPVEVDRLEAASLEGLWSQSELAGVVLDLGPMTLSGLALAGGNRGATPEGDVPGVLTAEELAGLDLRGCELAVLSACETDLGVRREGLRVQSLLTALVIAGARNAVTSTWKVDDEATQRLMREFYRRIWQEGERMEDALWNAKMTLDARRVPLRDWGGWVLLGG